MSEETLGAWCRLKGLHTHHLEKWKQEAVSGSMGAQDKTAQAQLKQLREQNWTAFGCPKGEDHGWSSSKSIATIRSRTDLDQHRASDSKQK